MQMIDFRRDCFARFCVQCDQLAENYTIGAKHLPGKRILGENLAVRCLAPTLYPQNSVNLTHTPQASVHNYSILGEAQ